MLHQCSLKTYIFSAIICYKWKALSFLWCTINNIIFYYMICDIQINAYIHYYGFVILHKWQKQRIIIKSVPKTYWIMTSTPSTYRTVILCTVTFPVITWLTIHCYTLNKGWDGIAIIVQILNNYRCRNINTLPSLHYLESGVSPYLIPQVPWLQLGLLYTSFVRGLGYR